MTEVTTENPITLTTDTKALLRYEANKKSAGVAYLLWVFLGMFGAHRFYMGKGGSGAAMLILTVLGFMTAVIGIGFVILGGVGIWAFVDLFLVGSWVKLHNLQILAKLGV